MPPRMLPHALRGVVRVARPLYSPRMHPQSSAFLGQGRSLHRLRFTPKMGTNPPVPVNPHHSSSSPPSAFFAFGFTSRSKPDRPSFTLPQPLISNCSRECARCDFGWGTLVRASHRTGTLCGRGVCPRTAVAPPRSWRIAAKSRAVGLTGRRRGGVHRPDSTAPRATGEGLAAKSVTAVELATLNRCLTRSQTTLARLPGRLKKAERLIRSNRSKLSPRNAGDLPTLLLSGASTGFYQMGLTPLKPGMTWQ